MKERPILFSGPMVWAILDDRKTQTRRIVKFAGLLDFEQGKDGVWHFRTAGGVTAVPCPYGVPGDRLWVRETWQAQEAFDDVRPAAIGEAFADEYGEPWCPIRYVADGKCEGSVDQWQESPLGKTRPAIHMPRWASRITLQVAEVRVERLQDISIEDAKAEGLEWVSPTFGFGGLPETWSQNPIDAYARLWEHINGPSAWDDNPWVWAVTFQRAQ